MKGCRDCENAIFVEWLGEYKCTISKQYTRAESNLRCKNWKQGKPVTSVNKKEEE